MTMSVNLPWKLTTFKVLHIKNLNRSFVSTCDDQTFFRGVKESLFEDEK